MFAKLKFHYKLIVVLDLLLEAYAHVAGKIGYPLHIAGHGPDEGKIRSLISKLKLENRVHMKGPLYGKKKFESLSEALYIAFPSRHDDFPVFSLEALASGNSLVTFDIEEFKIFPFDVSYKAKAFDTKDYSRILLRASRDKHLIRKRKICRKFARLFTWDKTAARYDKFFRKIMLLERKANVKS